MTSRPRPLALGALLVVLLAAPACVSRMNGLEQQLTFEYDTVQDITNFTKPLAVGARLDLRATELGSGRDVTLLSAESSEPHVVAVVTTSSGEVVLEGRGHGVAELRVRAMSEDGRVLSDRVPMLGAHPERVELGHACSEGPEAVYVAGSRATVGFAMLGAAGEPLVGWGLRPVRGVPDGGLELRDTGREQGALLLQLGGNTGRVALESTLPGDHGRWTFHLVEPRDIDSLVLEAAPDWTLEARESWAHVAPRLGGRPICQHRLALEATSLTPELCSVEPGPPGSEFVEITAHAFGICRYRVAMPQAPAAAPLELQLRIGKLPAVPGEGEADASAPSVTATPTTFQDALARWPLILALVFVTQLLLAPFWLAVARRPR